MTAAVATQQQQRAVQAVRSAVRVDEFGDLVGVSSATLSIAQNVARIYRESTCKWFRSNIPLSPPQPSSSTSSASTTPATPSATSVAPRVFASLPVDTQKAVFNEGCSLVIRLSVASFLASERLKANTVIQILVRHLVDTFNRTPALLTDNMLHAHFQDVVLFLISQLFHLSTSPHSVLGCAPNSQSPQHRTTPLSPPQVLAEKPLVLLQWCLAILALAENGYSKHERYFTACLKHLDVCLRSCVPRLRDFYLVVAQQSLSKVHLLHARHIIYNGGDIIRDARPLLCAAKDTLQTLIKQPGQHVPQACYYLARACVLLGEIEIARSVLQDAATKKILPEPKELLSEPDFESIRDAPWFAAICGIQPPAPNQLSPNTEYTMLKSSLMGGGFSVKKMIDHLIKPVMPTALKECGQVLTARQRLAARLAMYQLKERRDIPGDGNCQFYSLSDQMYDTIHRAADLRRTAVAWLEAHKEWDPGNGALLHYFVADQTWEAYCRQMSKSGTWGDNLTLIAISEHFRVRISVISSVAGDNFITEITPSALKGDPTTKVLLLCHFAEYHYGSLGSV
ncbi:OTU domain containing protein [Pelomyxa schiedti]|nr:OTU domain containing protein [Pelomyxa schiedti]